ncbi:hypothetical protein ACNQFZ_18390 [Schinkia sp. CFF1]
MLQGICIDTGQTTVLEKGKLYFLFQNGETHFYVSKFPRIDSHTGCYKANRFQIIQNIELNNDQNESYFQKNSFEQLSLFDM